MPADKHDPEEPPAAEVPDESAEVPMNRAERRAKGKRHDHVQGPGKILPGHVNVNHGHRQYTNRRSGGGGR